MSQSESLRLSVPVDEKKKEWVKLGDLRLFCSDSPIGLYPIRR